MGQDTWEVFTYIHLSRKYSMDFTETIVNKLKTAPYILVVTSCEDVDTTSVRLSVV
jgi:hypothetical protein